MKITKTELKKITIRDMFNYTEMLLTSILRESYFNYDLTDDIINEIENITTDENIKELKKIISKIDIYNLKEIKLNNRTLYNDEKFTRKDAYKFLKMVFDITINFIKNNNLYTDQLKQHDKQIKDIELKLIELSKYKK